MIVEQDNFDQAREAYHGYCTALKKYGAYTWGYTKEEALKNINEVVKMILEELREA